MGTARRLYYGSARPTAFSTLRKLHVWVTKKKKKFGDIGAWLEKQDDYTLHRPIRKRFACNPESVNNVMYVWECDLYDIRSLFRSNDNYKYILSVIDVFSKFLHLDPLRSKSRTAVASAFISIFGDSRRRRRPVWVRTHKGKELLNKHFQRILKRSAFSFRC